VLTLRHARPDVFDTRYHSKLDIVYINGAGDGATYDATYKQVRAYYLDAALGNEADIVKEVDALMKRFAEALLSASSARLAPYWPMLQALELADPSMPLPTGEASGVATWAAAELLCERTGIDFTEFQKQCVDMHSSYPHAFNVSDQSNCRHNLLRFYHTLAAQGGLTAWPAVREYARAVFTFPVTTVFIECLFSGMNLNKSDRRASMLDDTCIGILKCHELKRVLTRDDSMPEPPLSLDLERSLAHNIE
jgi:hypothetical protein